MLAEKAGQKPAVTETKAAQQIEAAAKADTSAGQSVDIRSVRLVWDHVPGAVKYQVEILGSAEDTLTNVIMTQNQIFANGVDIEVGRYGKAAANFYWKVRGLDYNAACAADGKASPAVRQQSPSSFASLFIFIVISSFLNIAFPS